MRNEIWPQEAHSLDCSVAVMRYHDRGNSIKRKHLTGGLFTVSEGPWPSSQGMWQQAGRLVAGGLAS